MRKFTYPQNPNNQRGLVRGVVVHDEMDVEPVRHGSLDLVEELAEFGGTVTSVAISRAANSEVVPCLL
jgi:hypothetical protein